MTPTRDFHSRKTAKSTPIPEHFKTTPTPNYDSSNSKKNYPNSKSDSTQKCTTPPTSTSQPWLSHSFKNLKKTEKVNAIFKIWSWSFMILRYQFFKKVLDKKI